MKNSSNPDLPRQIVYDGVFKPAECEKIISLINPEITDLYKIKKNEINLWIWNRIFNCARHANNKYYKFNISYLDNLQILEQSEKSISEWKIDLIEKFLTRKISIVVFLSNKKVYEGGQIYFDVDDDQEKELIPMVQGSIVIFPSFQFYKYQSITKGRKYIISGWIYGDSFC